MRLIVIILPTSSSSSMHHLKLCHLIVIVAGLWINHPMTSQAKFLLAQKSSFLGRLYKKITVPQPNYCFSFCGEYLEMTWELLRAFSHFACPPFNTGCGTANSINEQAGVQLQQNEYPWLALIYDPSDLETTYPGTLINDKYVVSSAGNFYGSVNES